VEVVEPFARVRVRFEATLRLLKRGRHGSEGRELLNAEFADGHYRVACEVRGRISLGDDECQVRGHGFRGHSWGPRIWSQPHYWRWLIAAVDERTWFDVFSLRLGESTQDFGIMCLDGVTELVERFEFCSSHSPAPHYLERVTVAVRTPTRELEIEGSVVSRRGRPLVVPLRHRREGEVARIAEMRLDLMDGRSMPGWAEYHDRIVGGRPSGAGVA
jgi:hypothetical protein